MKKSNLKFITSDERAEQRCNSCLWHGEEGQCRSPNYHKMLSDIYHNPNPECKYYEEKR